MYRKVIGARKFFRKVIVAIALLYGMSVYTSCSVPRYETQPVAFQVGSSPQLIKRGKALVTMMCADCHRDPVTNRLTGKHLTDVPRIMGTLYSKNITQHPTQGIGNYSEGQLAYLLRRGIDHQGYLSPIMAKPGIADEDLKAIIAYLKYSTDEAVQPAEVESKKSRYSMPAKMAFHLKVKPFDYPKEAVAMPEVSDQGAYGKYMVRMLGCYDCHSKGMASVDKLNPEHSKGYMGGGMKLKGLSGETIYTPNITKDATTGIGNWSKQDFVQAIREGIRPDRSVITYPMPNYKELSQPEAEAIYAYIQTIPAIRNQVKRRQAQTISQAQISTDDTLGLGLQLYTKYGCKACHGESGVGVADLRKAYQKFPDHNQLIAFIKNPSGFNSNSRMPGFEGIIAETDFKPLLYYVRWLGENSSNLDQQKDLK